MKTPDEAKGDLLRRGETVANWARRHGVDPGLARGVLNGRVKGHFGEAHKIAVLFGIKDGVIVEGQAHERA